MKFRYVYNQIRLKFINDEIVQRHAPKSQSSISLHSSLLRRFMLIPAWVSKYIPQKVEDEITNPFSNFNDTTVDVWKWIGNFIPHFTVHVIV